MHIARQGHSTVAVADLHSKILDAPPGRNSFNFMQFLGNLGKIVCWHPPGGLVPHLREILDPPLTVVNCTVSVIICVTDEINTII